jgi:succinoglycan biosynthesis protein ExoL
MNILYLVHDLSDPAVGKRIVMLQDGGAAVSVAGFRRTAQTVESVSGCPVIDLGQTFNGGFVQRLAAIMREVLLLPRRRALFKAADVIIARNLEMLAIAVRGRSLCAEPPVLVYESLDIHRLLLNPGLVGKALRWLEGWLSRRASALFTSSPAFVNNYFKPLSSVRLPVRLLENKVYPSEGLALQPCVKTAGPPWRIGWFGAIRCRKSLEALSKLVRESKGQVEVIIRGKPSFDQFDDFEKSTTEFPGLRYGGPYKYPDDLAAIYGDVHFTWAIDMFEEGLNSSWLLPNRLYEGGLFGAVPLALAHVETGRTVLRLGHGAVLDLPLDDSLSYFFKGLTAQEYGRLARLALAIPRQTWVYSVQDCKDLVAYLSSLRGQRT